MPAWLESPCSLVQLCAVLTFPVPTSHARNPHALQALPWSRLVGLLSDPEPGVVEQALVILRNLCMGDRQHIAAAMEWAAASPAAAEAAADAAGADAGKGTEDAGASAAGSGSGGGGERSGAQQGLLAVLQDRIEAAAAAVKTGCVCVTCAVRCCVLIGVLPLGSQALGAVPLVTLMP